MYYISAVTAIQVRKVTMINLEVIWQPAKVDSVEFKVAFASRRACI